MMKEIEEIEEVGRGNERIMKIKSEEDDDDDDLRELLNEVIGGEDGLRILMRMKMTSF